MRPWTPRRTAGSRDCGCLTRGHFHRLLHDEDLEALLSGLGEPSLETVEEAVAQLWSESGMPEPVRAQLLAALVDPSRVSAFLRGPRPNPRGSGPNVTQRLEAEGPRVEFRNLWVRGGP